MYLEHAPHWGAWMTSGSLPPIPGTDVGLLGGAFPPLAQLFPDTRRKETGGSCLTHFPYSLNLPILIGGSQGPASLSANVNIKNKINLLSEERLRKVCTDK